ncbi:unnamed protein product [Rhizophagus irregularis]|nr:unnamed protein product [Rhizophagus irregularis]
MQGKEVHIRRTENLNWGHLHFQMKEEAIRFYNLVKDQLPITGPHGKKFIFKRARKSDNDLTFPTSRLTSSLSSFTSEYNGTSTSNGSVTSSRDNHNNTQNKDGKSVTKLIRYSDRIN